VKPPPGTPETTTNSDGSKVVTLTDGTTRTVSAREIRMCAEKKIDLIAYAATKKKDQ